jgi:drug/metabolite transporter, DME family
MAGARPAARAIPVGPAALLAAAGLMGVSSVAAKLAYRHGAVPADLVVARAGIGGILFALALPLLLRAIPRPLGLRVWLWPPLVGGVIYLGTRAEFEGMLRLPAAVVIVVLVSAPAWAALFRLLVWRRRVRRRQAIALAGVLAGVALIAGPPGGGIDALGLGMALLAAFAAATLLLAVEHWSGPIPPTAAVPLAAIGSGAWALLAGLDGAVGRLDDGVGLVLPLFVLGAIGAAWAVLVGIGMRSTDSVTSGTVLAAEPVFVGVAAYLVLGETLLPREIAGCLVTLAAVLMLVLEGEVDPADGFDGRDHAANVSRPSNDPSASWYHPVR